MSTNPPGGQPPYQDPNQPWATPGEYQQPYTDPYADPYAQPTSGDPGQPGSGPPYPGSAPPYPGSVPPHPGSAPPVGPPPSAGYYDPGAPWSVQGTAGAAPGYGYPVRRPTNTLAIVSMVLSLAGLVACGLTSPVGAIMGHVARRQIRERGEEGDAFALTGVIVGWIVTALGIIGCGIYAAAIGFAISQDPSNY